MELVAPGRGLLLMSRGLAQVSLSDGRLVGELPDFARDPAALLPLYRAMVLTRTFDGRAIALQRTG